MYFMLVHSAVGGVVSGEGVAGGGGAVYSCGDWNDIEYG
jgi:hypothetical protein